MINWKQKINYSFGYNVSPELSILKLFLIKVNILVIFLSKLIREFYYQNYFSYTIRYLKNKGSEKTCIVMGNGPSLNKIRNIIDRILLNEKVEIIAVNQFPLTKDAETWKPTYLILSDPDSKPDSKNDFAIRLWQWIILNPDTKIIVPSEWSKSVKIKLGNETPNNVYFFCNLSLYGFTSNINPIFPRGYTSLTAYVGLAVANYLNFSKIYISGMDSDQFKYVNVNRENKMISKPNYFDENAISEEILLNELYSQGIGGYLYGSSASILSMRKCFSKVSIYNLDPNSLLDFFPKLRELE
jgi:hypothetical protein